MVCKATAVLCYCYRCCSLIFLLATAYWLEMNNSYTGQLLTAPDRSKNLRTKLKTEEENSVFGTFSIFTNQIPVQKISTLCDSEPWTLGSE